jgi:hypothetical protein
MWSGLPHTSSSGDRSVWINCGTLLAFHCTTWHYALKTIILTKNTGSLKSNLTHFDFAVYLTIRLYSNEC